MAGVFRTKRSIYRDTGRKDEKGLAILEKTGDTKVVERAEPDWAQSQEVFVKHFKDVPGIETIARSYFTKALIVDIQGKGRNQIAPENWTEANWDKFLKEFKPSQGRVKKSKEERAASELGMTTEELMAMLKKNAK